MRVKTQKNITNLKQLKIMFSKDLERLIEAALVDGVITDKERQIIHRRAAREGVDPDELDMILDSKIQELEQNEEEELLSQLDPRTPTSKEMISANSGNHNPSLSRRDAKTIYNEGVDAYNYGDYDSAFALFEESARMNYGRALYNLAVCYYNGIGTQKDNVLFFKYLNAAIAQNDAEALFAMGKLYANGFVISDRDRIPSNERKSIEYYKRAADNGYAEAQYELGKYYERYQWDLIMANNPSFRDDIDEYQRLAHKYYSLAANQDYLDSREKAKDTEGDHFSFVKHSQFD